MGSSAPTAPSFQLPSGAPSFQSSDSGINNQTLINAQTPGGAALWQAGGSPDVNSAQGQALGADMLGYGMSDADFAARYPGMVNAKNQYQDFTQNMLGTQTPYSMQQGNALSNAGAGLMPQAQSILGQGLGYQGQAQTIMNQGQSLAGQAQNFLNPAAKLAAQAPTAGAQDMALGQNLVSGNQAIDPMVQQEMMRSGLSSAAGSLGGAAALGGTAGQAAVGTQLGVGAQNWINQQRTMGQQLQQTGVGMDSGLAGAAGTLANAGTGVANAGSSLISTGTGVGGLGATLDNSAANMFNTGSGMMTGGQGIINNATSNANQTMGLASSLFQPRQFGIAGADAANINLSNTAGQNNMNQFIYGTKVGVAAQNAGIGAANANATAAANNANSQAAIGAGTAVASTAASVAAMSAMTCWVAASIYGKLDRRFYQFRFWLMNLAPRPFKKLYLRYGRAFAAFLDRNPSFKKPVRLVMDAILLGTPQYAYA